MPDPSTFHLLIPHLPDDLSLQCIARVPRSSHPSLLLVSRSWCSLLRSRRLFALRVELGVTEPSLCINIYTLSGESRLYFLDLCPCRLLPLPPSPFPTFGVGCDVIGSSLYVLGGYQDDKRTSVPAVQIFDPCLNRWTTARPMAEARGDPVVSALNGRIYVFGWCFPRYEFWYDDYDPASRAWAEVFDPATGAWASLPNPTHLTREPVGGSSVFGGQLLLANGLLLDPEAAQPWGTVPEELNCWWDVKAVVLDGVLYEYDGGDLDGYDLSAGVWKPVVLDGVEPKNWKPVMLGGVEPEYMRRPELTKLGGLLCFIWTHAIETDEEMERRMRGITSADMNLQFEIHCVGVQITRINQGGFRGFRGSVAWREVVANPIPNSFVGNAVVLEF